MASLQTIEQQRAKHELEEVNAWKGKGASDQKELLSYVTGIPAMILMSGFGQNCAFYKANKKGNHAEVLNALENWLQKGDLMAFITESSAQDYRLAQAESLAYLNWLKKFAKAYLKDDSEGANHVATA